MKQQMGHTHPAVAHVRSAAACVWLRLLLLLAAVVAASAAAAAAAADSVQEEATIMRNLRQLLYREDPHWGKKAPGWLPSNDAHHCSWQDVVCVGNRVTRLRVSLHHTPAPHRPLPAVSGKGSSQSDDQGADASEAPAWPVPPEIVELARLPHLATLSLRLPRSQWAAAIPPEWLQSDALPQLNLLELNVDPLPGAAPLPDIPPGALPRLQFLTLELRGLCTTLPASWGSPGVLPALEQLSLHVRVEGRLPPEWGAGFRSLRSLLVANPDDKGAPEAGQGPLELAGAAAMGSADRPARLSGPAPAPAALAADLPPRLPEEWAAGFGRLQSLMLAHLGLAGLLPDSWLKRGSFPSLTDLQLHHNALSGPLPPQIFASHPNLTVLRLEHNRFTGALPAEWAGCKAWSISLAGNSLAGPAFPVAWHQSMPELRHLGLSNNNHLEGTLPHNLAWPQLITITSTSICRALDGTSVSGCIPASWCSAPFNNTFMILSVKRTDLNPKLPPCAADYLQNLRISSDESPAQVTAPSASPSEQAQQAGQGQLAWTVSLAAVLPLCALVAVGVVGRLLWRRRLRQALRQALEQQRLLQAEEGWAGHGDEESSAAAPSADVASPAAPPASLVRLVQHGRLGSLLGCQLFGHPSRGIDAMPVGALSAALAHRLGSSEQQRRHRGSQGRRAQQGSARYEPYPAAQVAACQPEQQRCYQPPPLSASALELSTLRPAPSAASMQAVQSWLSDSVVAGPPEDDDHGATTAVQSWRSQSLAAGPPEVAPGLPTAKAAEGATAAGSTNSRPWRLPTKSLRVPSTAIMFVTDKQGRLVEIGCGRHATVFLARLLPEGKLVAVKVFELEPGVDSRLVWKEVAMLRQCRHPRVVPLLGVMLKGSLLMIAMELKSKGSLKAALRDAGMRADLCWAKRGRRVALDVAEALDHLHTQLGVMHSDLKPANVLLSDDWRACLADLGLAQILGTRARTAAGFSHTYAAPEQLMGQRCTLSADVYSFGLLLVSLLTQQLVVERGGWRLPRAPEECPQEVVVLVEECLAADPRKRPTAAQALARLQATAF